MMDRHPSPLPPKRSSESWWGPEASQVYAMASEHPMAYLVLVPCVPQASVHLSVHPSCTPHASLAGLPSPSFITCSVLWSLFVQDHLSRPAMPSRSLSTYLM